jgi:hypothetical protein
MSSYHHHRTNYKRVLLFFSFATILILLLTIARFDGGDHHLRNDVLFKSNMNGNRNGTGNELVFWSSDFHISPIADIKNIITSNNVKVIDKSLSGHCHLSNTCQHDLRVIDRENGITLGECPNTLINEFYESYKNDLEMKSVSAFLCTHACSLCELFMPFNKPMIIIASTRYDIEMLQLLHCSKYLLFHFIHVLAVVTGISVTAFLFSFWKYYCSLFTQLPPYYLPYSLPFICPTPSLLSAQLPSLYLPYSLPFICPPSFPLSALLPPFYFLTDMR